MFNKKNFEKLGNEIYLYKNFANEEECSVILQETRAIKENEWNQFTETGRSVSSLKVYSTLLIRERIRSLVDEGCSLGNSLSVQRMLIGAFGPPHIDNHGFENVVKANSLYVEGSEFELKENSYYGTVFYFNEFEGGSLYYPNQGVHCSPNIGDLIIHSSFEPARHGILKVTKGVRYSYANHIYKNEKVPKGYLDGN